MPYRSHALLFLCLILLTPSGLFAQTTKPKPQSNQQAQDRTNPTRRKNQFDPAQLQRLLGNDKMSPAQQQAMLNALKYARAGGRLDPRSPIIIKLARQLSVSPVTLVARLRAFQQSPQRGRNTPPSGLTQQDIANYFQALARQRGAQAEAAAQANQRKDMLRQERKDRLEASKAAARKRNEERRF